MIRARSLIRESFSFLKDHPSLLFYSFLYFLPSLLAITGIILLAISLGVLSMVTFNFSTILGAVLHIIFGSFGSIIIMGSVFCFTVIISLGFTVYIQGLLHKTHASMFSSLKESWKICGKVWWVIPLYCLYSFSYSLPFGFLFAIGLSYFHQLLIDGETSFTRCLQLSWSFFQKTFWVLLRFFVLFFMIIVFSGFLTFLSLILAIKFFIFRVLFVIMMCGLIFLYLTATTVLRIGMNKLYLEVKQQN